ncbi:hypothetical protein IPG41_04895 [Candidatus Peregrinibacteria bacterium]|nr:MAG: hypothetical protein IPG41_04895 [Candidatus Peregrinibacteria bacterium]
MKTFAKKPWKFLFFIFNLALFAALVWSVLNLVHAPAGMHLELTSNMENLTPEERVELRFVIRDINGEVLKDFARVHEKLLHLVVVREDLTEFQHLHPDFDKETGEFSVDLAFPKNGPYKIYADFTPEHLTQTVLQSSVQVGEEPQFVAEPLIAGVLEPFPVGSFTVSPIFPETLFTGTEMKLSFEVEKDGEEVELEPYLGAEGHCVILRSESLDYLHSHPVEDGLQFEVLFEEPGLYQSFTQFQVGGQIYTFPFAFEVTENARGSEEDSSHMEH